MFPDKSKRVLKAKGLGAYTNNATFMIESIVESCGLIPSLHFGLVTAGNTSHGTSRGRATTFYEELRNNAGGKLTYRQRCPPRYHDQQRTSSLVIRPYPVGSSGRDQES